MSDDLFWDGLARMLNKYFESYETEAASYFGIDSIVNAEIRVVNGAETRVIADSYSSESDGKSFENYKISIKTNAQSLEEFEKTFPFKSFQDLNGKVNVNMVKNRVVLNAT